jgi:tetratricopeptide (TPR) repeat protein
LAQTLPRGHEEVVTACREAVRLAEKLLADHAGNRHYRELLMDCRLSLGARYSAAGRNQEAETIYREILALMHQGDGPRTSRGEQVRLARTRLWLGRVLLATGRLSDAEEAYREARMLYEQFVEDFPHDYDCWQGFSEGCRVVVRELERTGRPGEAAKYHSRALDLYARFVAQLPDDPAYFDNAAAVTGTFANLLKDGGDRPEREAAYRRALGLAEKLAARFPRHHYPRFVVAYWHESLGSALAAAGQTSAAESAYRQAADRYRAALGLNPGHVGTLNNLAWLLSTCPVEGLRDGRRAVELARQAVERTPQHGYVWNTLGLAHYRAGEWRAALAALEKSMALYAARPEGERLESFNTFPLALAHQRLGNQEEARRWYDRAVGWMEKHRPKDEELRRLRAEAEDLIRP